METIRVVFRHPQGKAPLTLELPRDTRFSALTPLLYEIHIHLTLNIKNTYLL